MRGIEGQVVSAIFKALVTRFVRSAKEVKASEAVVSNNIFLLRNSSQNPNAFFFFQYCEVRQLITYVKEAHSSTFRRVALSALVDTADRPSKKTADVQTTRVIR